MATALRPAASGIVLMSASTSAPCTILARRARPGSSSPYLTRIDSKEQRPSTCPSSAPSTSNGVASFSFATRPTSRGSTYRNSASASMKRRTSHGHAIRSTAAFLRVTHRMVLCLLALLRQPDRLLRAQPLKAAPRCHPRGARSRRQPPRQHQPSRVLHLRVQHTLQATYVASEAFKT